MPSIGPHYKGKEGELIDLKLIVIVVLLERCFSFLFFFLFF